MAVVVDQLTLDCEELVVEYGISVGQRVYLVCESGEDLPDSITDDEKAVGLSDVKLGDVII